MDRNLARKIESNEEFRKKLNKLVKDYTKLGLDNVEYWTADFDTALDLVMSYAPMKREDFEKLERGNPRRFTLPMTATQITTMTTFISQVLFGQNSPHRVEGRGPEDEIPAEFMNQLLRWNAEQQPTYVVGYLWVQDCLTFNRGIFYNSWQPIYRPTIVPVEVEDAAAEVDPATQKRPVYQTFRRTQTVVGGYNKMELVSPYDWFCDPALPLWRYQEGRFAGHKFKISWNDLQRRSKLAPESPAYTLPTAVERLKTGKRGSASAPSVGGSVTGTGGNPNQTMMSRSAFERSKSGSPLGQEKADKTDPGMIDCIELWVTLVPKDYDLHEGEDVSTFQFVVGNGEILSVNESTFAHGQFPYSVGEGRPCAQFQFSPGWAFMLKGLQDYIDWLKNRHQEALARTVGNVFIADPSKVDLDDFLDPDKEGLLITLKATAAGQKIGDVIQQVPIKDLTENFNEEMMGFVAYSETVTGATAAMQGQVEGDPSATQFAGAQQMSAGRLSAIARVLSVMGLTGQTRQFVSNFQQFLSAAQSVRFRSDRMDLPEELRTLRSVTISRDTIQGEFDIIPHDGTLPGVDAKKVAGITRLLDAAAGFPQVFSPAPGNLDPRRLIYSGAKASGVDVENFVYTPEALAEATAGVVSSQTGILPQVLPPGTPTTAVPPGPKPAGLPGPQLPDVSLESISPPQARPANV